ncbi:MAG: hypothetical protein JO115_05705 [Pseudonocardiales bacterium]|nr:hypothetical protein [Pseudonocardiales bacterium]
MSPGPRPFGHYDAEQDRSISPHPGAAEQIAERDWSRRARVRIDAAHIIETEKVEVLKILKVNPPTSKPKQHRHASVAGGARPGTRAAAPVPRSNQAGRTAGPIRRSGRVQRADAHRVRAVQSSAYCEH